MSTLKIWVGKQICHFEFQIKYITPKTFVFDRSVPAKKIVGKLLALKFSRRSLVLKAVIETSEGCKEIEVCPIDKYADNNGVWAPVTDYAHGKKVELQFIDEYTFVE